MVLISVGDHLHAVERQLQRDIRILLYYPICTHVAEQLAAPDALELPRVRLEDRRSPRGAVLALQAVCEGYVHVVASGAMVA